ncbi:MAG: tRNA(Ile)(2)-agmatinylcytidine synthase [Nitrososphaerota archaeon]
MLRFLRIGLDDTDSKKAMCTTYVAAKLLERLQREGYKPLDYPWLVRLNPNCPYKTRGNAALALTVEAKPAELDRIVDAAVSIVKEWADLGAEGTDPGLIFAWNNQVEGLREIYWRALTEILEIDEVKERCDELGVHYITFKEGRGVVGAAAAAAADPDSLATYEAIAYRVPSKWGLERGVEESSVIEMDKRTRPYTFDNYDYEKKEVRITPHTPCPVLAGVRAITPAHAEEGLKMTRFLEPIDFYVVFRTNQAGDLHYVPARICEVRPNTSYIVKGRVYSKPTTIPGGHVLVTIEDETGRLTLAAYEPTGQFRRIVEKLIPGDEVLAYGAVKIKDSDLTLNLEKLAILKLAALMVRTAPKCELCGRKMKSMGREKGYRCKRCGVRRPDLTPALEQHERKISEGVYEVCVSARRHLTMPLTIKSLLRHHKHG